MRVKKLVLENFRIHRNSTLSFGESPFVVIRGRNFAGKSTIGQGLSMCLTPSTSGLDAQGKGFISKIKRGATKATITADFQTKHHTIQRIVTLNTNTTGRTQKTICLSDPAWNPARFDAQIEKQRAALTVVLNTDAFLRMDEEKQKNLLAGLALPSRYDFDPQMVAGTAAMLPLGTVNFAGEPFVVINQAYRKLFDERQIVNRQVKEFLIPEELPAPAGVDSASLQSQLGDLRQQRFEVQRVRDEAVASATRQEQARNRAKERIQETSDNERRRETAIRNKLLKDGQFEYLSKIAVGKKELEKLETERAACLRMREHNNIQLKALEAAPWGAKACPTCEQPVDAEQLKVLNEKLARRVQETNAGLTVLEQKIKALGDVAGAVEAIRIHEEARKELEAFEAQSAERLRKAEAAQQAVPEPVLFSFEPFNQSLGECDAEIEQLTNLLRPVIVAEERRKEVEMKQGQLTALKEKAAVLDRLVKYFDKDGIKAKLIGEYIGGFEHKLNSVMKAWGYSCALSIEPYSFDITNTHGDVIPVRELSGAERVMFSLAFQCAVSMTASIGLVVIDEVAMFLPEIRPVLYRRLYEMIEDGFLEQVILLVADASEQTANLPGMVFYFVEDGEVRPLLQSTTQKKETMRERPNDQRNIA